MPDCQDRCPGTYGVGAPGLPTDGCPDFDLDGVPDYLDYCPTNPGELVDDPGVSVDKIFSFVRKLEDGTDAERTKYLNIMGCRDEDGDLVPDNVDMCDGPSYPQQANTDPTIQGSNDNIDGVVVVDNKGCPLDSDRDGVFDGIDMCDGTIHSQFDIHDSLATVYTADYKDYDGSGAWDNVLGCPIDTDGDGVVDGIDQVSSLLVSQRFWSVL